MTAAIQVGPAAIRPPRSRYSAGAIVFHWLIAALILTNIAIAWYFNGLPRALRDAPTQWHKSIGITVLVLTLGRIAWRIFQPPPKLPDTMRPWEHWIARGSHFLFYLLMLGLPLSGWAMVSASPLIKVHPIVLFGVVPWPTFPFPGVSSDGLHSAHRALTLTHGSLALVAYALITLHVLAALKHQFFDRDDVMARMLPFMRLRGKEAT